MIDSIEVIRQALNELNWEYSYSQSKGYHIFQVEVNTSPHFMIIIKLPIHKESEYYIYGFYPTYLCLNKSEKVIKKIFDFNISSPRIQVDVCEESQRIIFSLNHKSANYIDIDRVIMDFNAVAGACYVNASRIWHESLIPLTMNNQIR